MKLGLTTYCECNKVGAFDGWFRSLPGNIKTLIFARWPVTAPPQKASTPSGSFISVSSFALEARLPKNLFFDCGLRNRGKAVGPPQVRKKGIHDSGNTAILRKHGSQSVYENCGNRIPNPSRRPKKTQPPITVREQYITQQVSGAMRPIPANASVNWVTACHQHLVKCGKGAVLSVSSPSAVDS